MRRLQVLASVMAGAAAILPAASAAPPEFVFATSGEGIATFWLGDAGSLRRIEVSPLGPPAHVAAVHPSNRYLYTVQRDTTGVRMFRIGTGRPSPYYGTLYSGGPAIMDLTSVVLEPAGRFLYTTDTLVDVVRGFAVDSATGALTVLGAAAAIGANAGALAVDPAGRFLYAAASGFSAGLYVYAIDSATGHLTPVPGSPIPVAVAPRTLLVHPSGRFLFGTSGWTGETGASAYAIGPTGLPEPLTSLPASWASKTFDFAITPSGRFLYASHGPLWPGILLSVVEVDAASGTLAEVSGSPFGVPGGDQLMVDPSGRYLITEPEGDIWSFRIGPDGRPTPHAGFEALYAYGDLYHTNHDAIFRDGFETGNLAAWSSSTGTGLRVSSDAALHGVSGLAIEVMGPQASFVTDESPDLEPRYRARLRLGAGSFDPGVAGGFHRVRVLVAIDAATGRRVFALVLRLRDGEYAVSGRVLLDAGGRRETPFVPLTAGPHDIQVHWEKATATGVADGVFELFVDGHSVARLDAVASAGAHVDAVRLGAMGVKSGASGELRFDAFESRRYNFIPPP